MRRALEQLIEPVEIQRDKISGKAIGLRFSDDELARPVAVRRETPPEHRDERLQRPERILRLLISPEQVSEPIRRDAVSARGEQDLQDLFRASATEIARAERSEPFLDFKRAEQTDHRRVVATIGVIRTHEWFDEVSSPCIPVSVLRVLLQLLIVRYGCRRPRAPFAMIVTMAHAESVSTKRALEPAAIQSVAFSRALPPKEKK